MRNQGWDYFFSDPSRFFWGESFGKKFNPNDKPPRLGGDILGSHVISLLGEGGLIFARSFGKQPQQHPTNYSWGYD